MHGILLKLQRELFDGVSDLTAEQTQMRRGAGKWTIQQIFEHLLLSYAATSAVVGTRVEKGAGTKARPTPMQRVAQFAITTVGVFPQGRRAPATVMPADVPVRCLCAREMHACAAEALTEMDAALQRAEELFGGKRRVISHLVLGPMSVGQWRRFHLVHGEHHLRQILRTRRAMGC